jgi:C4-dicarboxylate transporter DctQ subunit
MAVVDLITNVAAVMGGIVIVTMALMITVAVLIRYYFHLSVAWSTELAEYFIYLNVVLASPWVLRKDAHVVVDVFVNILKPETRRRVAVFINLLGAVTVLVLFYYSALATYENYLKGTQTIRIMPVPKYLPLLFIPIMSILLAFQFLRKVWQNLYPSSPSVENKG